MKTRQHKQRSTWKGKEENFTRADEQKKRTASSIKQRTQKKTDASHIRTRQKNEKRGITNVENREN